MSASMSPVTGQELDGQQSERIQLLDYWRVLVQRRVVVGTCLGVVLAATLVFTFIATPTYRATTTLEIERQAPEILEFTDVLGVDPAGYKDFYQTQHKILQSRTVIRLAAERLDLMHRPEYAGRKGAPLGRLVGWARGLVSTAPADASDPLESAADFIEGRLSILPVRNSHLVRVSVIDRDARLAAEMADAVAAAYQQFQLEVRYDTTGKAKEFLTKDVARVQQEIAALQRQLQDYGVENEILDLSDGAQDISEQALADINSRYTAAWSRTAAAEARYESLRDAEPQALPEVLQSPTIAHLRQETGELERRRAQMSERFNPDWPPLTELDEELAMARRQMEVEARTIAVNVAAVAEADFLRARSELESLSAQRSAQKREVQRVNRDTIEYAGLQAEIETKRHVLAGMVERQSETETSFRLRETSTSNIRVVDPATAPKYAASPRKTLNVILALLVGSALGVGMAFLVDHLDNTVKNEQDLQRVGGITVLGHVPLTQSLHPVGEETGAEDLTRQLDIGSHLDPRSNFSETFRNLRTSLLLATPDHPPRHIAVTSCEPGDGKSTVALNLAIVLTQLGRRVLLVDADLRRPRVHKSLLLGNEVGISSYLSGNAPLEDLIQESEIPNLRVISSGPIPPNPSELLGSPGLQTLLERFAAEDRFDHVIFDSPPVLSVTDAIILSTRIDSTILVVRSGVTSREALAQSAARLKQSRARVTGSVLNAVSHETGYYYGRYGYGRSYRYAYGAEEGPQEGSKTRRARKGLSRRRAG